MYDMHQHLWKVEYRNGRLVIVCWCDAEEAV